MSFLKKYFEIILIIVLVGFTYSPLFVSGWFPVHDDEQIGRLFELNKDVVTGQLPPRLAQDLGFGFDYPLFNFYPSFIYYIAEIFHLIGFPYLTSTKLMIGLGFVLAAVFMYLFSKDYVGKIGGVVASIAYSYTPYHSADVYVRGALPEFWSFVFVPALFWSYQRLAKNGGYLYFILSSVFVACFVLTHNLIAMMSIFFLGAFLLYLVIQSRNKWLLVRKICLSFFVGMGLSAYFWLPGYLEKDNTMVYLLTQQGADFHLYFVCIKQFLNSPWGYGGSIPGCSDGISFQVGQAQLVLAFISVIVSAFLLFKKRKGYGIAVLFIILFLFSLFIQTKYSLFIWDKIQPFSYIQFPWRFLIFSDFTIAFLTAFIFSQLKTKQVKILVAVVMIVLLIVLNKDYFRPSKYLTTITDQDYISPSVIRWKTSAMSYEYTPKGIAINQPKSGNATIAITQNEVPTSTFAIVRGKMTVKPFEDIPQQKIFQVTVAQSGLLKLNTFTFPGWKTYVDGKEVAYSDRNKYKLITVALPKGKHTVRATFIDTPVRIVGNSVSVFSVLSVLVWGILKRKKYGKN